MFTPKTDMNRKPEALESDLIPCRRKAKSEPLLGRIFRKSDFHPCRKNRRLRRPIPGQKARKRNMDKTHVSFQAMGQNPEKRTKNH